MQAKNAEAARQTATIHFQGREEERTSDAVPPLDDLALEVGYGLVQFVDECALRVSC